MPSRTTGPWDIVDLVGSRRSFILLAVLLMASTDILQAQPTETPAIRPLSPAAQVQEQDIRSLSEDAPVKKWEPGDPIRIVPDLREDGSPEVGQAGLEEQNHPLKPIVRKPVTPQVMEKDLDELTKVEPYEEGDSIRVVPDLKESESEQ